MRNDEDNDDAMSDDDDYVEDMIVPWNTQRRYWWEKR